MEFKKDAKYTKGTQIISAAKKFNVDRKRVCEWVQKGLDAGFMVADEN